MPKVSFVFNCFALFCKVVMDDSMRSVARIDIQDLLRLARNPDNCAMFVLKKNVSSHAVYPYYLDDLEGDRAMSSIDLAHFSVILSSSLHVIIH